MNTHWRQTILPYGEHIVMKFDVTTGPAGNCRVVGDDCWWTVFHLRFCFPFLRKFSERILQAQFDSAVKDLTNQQIVIDSTRWWRTHVGAYEKFSIFLQTWLVIAVCCGWDKFDRVTKVVLSLSGDSFDFCFLKPWKTGFRLRSSTSLQAPNSDFSPVCDLFSCLHF